MRMLTRKEHLAGKKVNEVTKLKCKRDNLKEKQRTDGIQIRAQQSLCSLLQNDLLL